jgi:Transcriptional regulators
MNKELNVLESINSIGNTTQRDIAKLTGISLGNVNAAIKSLIAKGYLIKATGKEKEVQYVLTDEGKRKKSIALLDKYSDVIRSVSYIQNQIEEVLGIYCTEKCLKPVLFGEEDEIISQLRIILHKMNIKFDERKIADRVNINYNGESSIFIVWHPDTEAKVRDSGLNYINIIDKIDINNR